MDSDFEEQIAEIHNAVSKLKSTCNEGKLKIFFSDVYRSGVDYFYKNAGTTPKRVFGFGFKIVKNGWRFGCYRAPIGSYTKPYLIFVT